ncbi:imm11 family protein [Sphingomonas sp. CFBP 13706]|uniref:imm11 family protein n=1 Tax=Sphingomonas sp. CFBP 13706 TaxID=2775314 RepID=UPI00177EB871|nr:DUF1629 domain-containing protein [Sphingomonas sp. CFBP 13706]MBD8737838.1 hypothetical protein [Sphingomonas sp. CFBP 13706]
MAWIIHPKPLARWIVGTKTVPDGQEIHQARLRYRFEDPKGRTPFGGSVIQQGLKVPLDLFPREAYVLSSTKSPPDFLTIGGWAVSDAIKAIIEQVEPGIHQFVHVPTFLKSGAPTPKNYYIAVLGHVATNQIDDERTTLRRNPAGEIEPPSPDGRRGDVAIHREHTAGWHAWWSADIYFSFTISDELNSLLLANEIPGLDKTHLAER